MRKKHKRENKALKLLIWIAAAAGVTVVALFALLTSREQQQEHKNADKRQQAEPLVIEVPEQATEGSIRVFDYDGCCIYAYYGKIEIRNDGRDGKEIDIVCAGYLEGYEEHKEPDGTGKERKKMSNVYIRSQNREKLYIFGISFNSLQYEEQHDYKRGKEEAAHHTICIADGCLEKIAEYESKERCIEVLDEIEKVCGSYLYAAGSMGLIRGSTPTPPMATDIPRVYQMPER